MKGSPVPFISVVIPSYNRSAMLIEILRSLEHQTWGVENFEVIVVHDAKSSDDAWDRMQEYSKVCPYRHQFVLKAVSDRTGPARSRNIGIELATGEIVAFTDNDCVSDPCWLECGMKPFSDGSVGIVQGATEPCANEAKPLLYKTVSVRGFSKFETCNIFYRRDLLNQLGGFHRDFVERYAYPRYSGEDIDLAYRALDTGATLVFEPSARIYHHILPISFKSWLLEPQHIEIWPYLVRIHPRIRREMHFAKMFFTPMTALFDLGLVGLVLAMILSPYFVLFFLPFVLFKYREGSPSLCPLIKLARVVPSSLRAFVIFISLVRGSLRFRTLVL